MTRPFRLAEAAEHDMAQMDLPAAQGVLYVIRFGLSDQLDPDDLDEGRVNGYLYRRGLTKEQRHHFMAEEAFGEGVSADVDTDDATQAWNYVIIYRHLHSSERIRFKMSNRSVKVERILHDRAMADLALPTLTAAGAGL